MARTRVHVVLMALIVTITPAVLAESTLFYELNLEAIIRNVYTVPITHVEPVSADLVHAAKSGRTLHTAITTATDRRSAHDNTELLVSVAASLTDVAHELRPLFEAQHSDVSLQFNFGSSGALAQQVARGAPVDVLILAAEGPIVRLQEQGHIAPETVRHVADNRLVLIAPARQSISVLVDWRGLQADAVKTVAIGNPGHVPAGDYAQQTLMHLGLWEPLRPKLVFAEDVRQALHYVRLGAVDSGVVYATDAASTAGVRVIAPAPSESHSPIVYLAARTQSSRYPREADALIEFLFAQEAREVFARHGLSDVE